MANVSVTHTFTNSTTADATQVNTNFTDIINGTSDGTKDFSIAALTTAGTVTMNGTVTLGASATLTVGAAASFNGNVTLGNATSDDITVTGSLASSIPIKTTFSYDIGSAALGLRDAYFGSSDGAGRSTKIRAGTVATNNTVTLPINTGTLPLTSEVTGSREISNLGIACSVASNALTIALKTQDGGDAAATDLGYVAFRSDTLTTGVNSRRSVSAAASLVIDSGATLGLASSTTHFLYVYLIDNASTAELAISGVIYDDGTVVSTTAVTGGGAGSADSNRVMYSTTARANAPVRLFARLTITTGAAHASGTTWVNAPTTVSLAPFEKKLIGVSYQTNTAMALTGGVVKIIDFEDKYFDTHNAVVVGGSWAFTAPRSGLYLVNATARLGDTALSDGQSFVLYIYRNGSNNRTGAWEKGNATSTKHASSIHAQIYLDAGDTLDIRALSAVDSSLNPVSEENWVMISFLGAIN